MHSSLKRGVITAALASGLALGASGTASAADGTCTFMNGGGAGCTLAFPDVGVGSSGMPHSLELVNDTGLSGGVMQMTTPPGFTVDLAGCDGVTLAPSQSCNILVSFSPLTAGPATDSVQLGLMFMGSPVFNVVASLSGTGTGGGGPTPTPTPTPDPPTPTPDPPTPTPDPPTPTPDPPTPTPDPPTPTPDPTPVVSSISPASVDANRANVVTIAGVNFGSASSDLDSVVIVPLGGGSEIAATSVIWVSTTALAATIPSGVPAGTYGVRVTVRGVASTVGSTLTVIPAATTIPDPTHSPPPTTPTPKPEPNGTTTFTGTDGSSANTGDMTTPGGDKPNVENGAVTIPSGNTTPATVSAEVTKGSSNTEPTTDTSTTRPTTSVRIIQVLSLSLTPTGIPTFKASYAATMAAALNISGSRADLIPLTAKSATPLSLRRAQAPAACSAATPVGARCRVTWTLPKLAPGDWSLTLRYGGLAIPATLVSQPGLKVTANGNKCFRRTSKSAKAKASIKTEKGSKLALVAIKLQGSKLSCKGKAGTTDRQIGTGKPRLVSKTPGNAKSLTSGLRKLAKGDYALVWTAGSANTPSVPVVTYLKVQ